MLIIGWAAGWQAGSLMVHRLLLFLGPTSMTNQHAQLRHTVAQIHP